MIIKYKGGEIVNIEIIDVTVPTISELISAFDDYDNKCKIGYFSLKHLWGWAKNSVGAVCNKDVIIFGSGFLSHVEDPEDGIVLPVIHAKVDDLDYCGKIINYFGVDWYVSSFDIDSIVCLFPYRKTLREFVYPTDNLHAEEKVKNWFEEIKKSYKEK